MTHRLKVAKPFLNKRPPGLIAPPFIIGFLATDNLPKVSFKHCSNSLKDICALGKSYLVITCPNSYEKLTKSEIRSNWSRFRHCSKSFIYPLGSHIRSLFAPIHMTSWPKSLVQVGVGSNIAQNHSSSQYEVLSGHYLPQFTCKVDQNQN